MLLLAPPSQKSASAVVERTATFRQRADRQQFPAEANESVTHHQPPHRTVPFTRLPNENREQTACRERRDRDGGVARGASQRLVIGAFGRQAAACNPPFRKTATPPSLLGQCLRYMRGTDELNEERSVGWADSGHCQLASSVGRSDDGCVCRW